MKDFFPFDVIFDFFKISPLFISAAVTIVGIFLVEGAFGINEVISFEEFSLSDSIPETGDLFAEPEDEDEFFTSSDSIFDFEIIARRVGCGLATAGLGGVGTGIGMVFRGLIEGLSRNPSVKDDMFSYAIFGFALTEAIGLFSLMIAFMLLYA